jgi:hypothetical protein
MNHLLFDAILRNWSAVRIADEDCSAICIIGQIEHDRLRRFTNGRWILTSSILTPVSQIVPGNIIRSLNMRYLLSGAVH